MTRRLQGHILTPDGFVAGELRIANEGRIADIGGTRTGEEQAVASGRILLPGFIDLHVHGGGGFDVMQGGDAAAGVARCHARFGTTSLLATTMTAPPEDLQQAFAALRPAHRERPRGAARILGVHLEGPYISDAKLGAQPAHTRPVSMEELAHLHEQVPVRIVTLAPDVPGNLEAIAQLVAQGHRVQLGHSAGSYEQAVQAMEQGARGFTHLFNAMSPLQQRAPGLVGAALAHGQHAEIIPDLLHVHPGAIRAALRCIPGVYCVTDSTAATAMPDGEYQLGRQAVTKCLGGVRLADGTLAGSTLTMDRALRNLVRVLGLTLQQASRLVSTHAAAYLGVMDRGRIGRGAWADIVVLDTELQVREVYVEGEAIEPGALADAA
jgi:N-acetylglucosamine-6-phosphate deacetylase